jgi:Protein of unknown function (DUF3108)
MNRWARVDRRALARRVAWACVLSAALHTVLLAVIEPLDTDALRRADWPALDVKLARLDPEAMTGEHPTEARAPREPFADDLNVAARSRAARPAKKTANAHVPRAPHAQRPVKRAPRPVPQPAIIMGGYVPMPPSPDGDEGSARDADAKSAGGAGNAARGDALAAFPHKLELEYSVLESEGQTVLGWMVYRFEREGDRYRMRLAVDAIGVASFFVKGRYLQRSEGLLTAGGFMPEHFMMRRGRRERIERADFNWSAARATLSDAQGSRELSLQAGTQDLLSVVYQIAFLMGEQENPATVVVTDGRRFHTAHLQVVGRETVRTDLGPMETIHIRSELKAGWNVQLWLAPDFGYLLARLRLRDKRGREAEQVLASIKVQW